MLGGTAAWYAVLKAGAPIAAVDRRAGVAFLKTRRGNVVAAAQDAAGRVFMFDKAGNIYYDTEDPRLGFYIVDTAGEMYNEYASADGTVTQTYVGNIGDLRSIRVAEVGGVPVGELQASVKGFRGGAVIGFPKSPGEGEALAWENLMPPNAPAGVPRAAGGRVRPPPMLEDFEVDLAPSGGGVFGGRRAPDAVDAAETLKTLRREK